MGTSISLLRLYIHIPSHFTSRSIYCTQEHILPFPVHAHVHLLSSSVHFLSPLTLIQVMKIILGLVYFKFCAKKNKFSPPDSVCFCCILRSYFHYYSSAVARFFCSIKYVILAMLCLHFVMLST